VSHPEDHETPLSRAAELCVEVAGATSSRKELTERMRAYLGAGAEEFWIIYQKSQRCEFYGRQGLMQRSAYPVELANLFA
jgi:Uma2 family endonuclease